jgi:hypothetical protein
MAEHPGQVFLDVFARREVERLAEIEKARKRPGSVWYERPDLWDGTTRARSASSESSGGAVEPSGSGSRSDFDSLLA